MHFACFNLCAIPVLYPFSNMRNSDFFYYVLSSILTKGLSVNKEKR